MAGTKKGGGRRVREKLVDEGNILVRPITTRRIVTDPQFRSGYRDRLMHAPPRRFWVDPNVSGSYWNYERGRMLATWLLATGKRPPRPSDVDTLVRYLDRAFGEGP